MSINKTSNDYSRLGDVHSEYMNSYNPNNFKRINFKTVLNNDRKDNSDRKKVVSTRTDDSEYIRTEYNVSNKRIS